MINSRPPLPFVLGKKRPKIPTWRSKGRFVTAIIGLHGRPGVLLCADSEETVSGYSKKMVDKIEQWDHEPFRFSIGGAGASHYADMVAGEITKALFRVQTFSLPEIQEAIAKPLLEFYATHVWPRVSNDSAVEANIQLIIVVQPLPGGTPEIFHTSETSVAYLAKKSYVSIGIGSHLADYILETMYSPSGGVEHLVNMGVLVMRHVADNVAQVGNKPTMYFYGCDGTARWIWDDEIAAIDQAIEEWMYLGKVMFLYATDVGLNDTCIWKPQRLAELLDESRNKFREVADNTEERERRMREWSERKASGK